MVLGTQMFDVRCLKMLKVYADRNLNQTSATTSAKLHTSARLLPGLPEQFRTSTISDCISNPPFYAYTSGKSPSCIIQRRPTVKMVLEAIRYTRGSLEVLDQKKLPHEEFYIKVNNPRDGWHAIQSMQVRGAPAIAIVAALSLAVCLETGNEHARTLSKATSSQCTNFISQSLKYLVTSRPTAVNLADAARKLEKLVFVIQSKRSSKASDVQQGYIDAAEKMLLDDVQDNENIGRHGAEWILEQASSSSATNKLSVLTHCNTGYVQKISSFQHYDNF